MTKGIDISVHNGNIDFQTAKREISFVMIRSSWGFFQEDTLVEQNVKKCEAEAIPYGFYHYSYATNLEEAKKEVDGVLNLIQRYNPTYPIVIDMEDADGWKEKNGNPSNETYVEICEYFCNCIQEAGYYAMIYANYDWWIHRLNDKRLERFDKWLADWRGLKNPSLPCGIWQYTSSEKILGIQGNVDANISYKDYPTIIKNLKKNNPIKTEEDGTSPNLLTEESPSIYYEKINYTGNSIVEALKSINIPASYDEREKIAKKNEIENYTGTPTQNLFLLSLLKDGLLKKLK